jgi:MFS transporter, DHA2 family, multidrug resistance protein
VQAQATLNKPIIDTPKLDASWVRWIIAITVSFAALLEVLDTSIVNVALTHMQGNLGATLSEIGWVSTGYSIANAIVIPLSAWLGKFFGKKGYFVFSLVGFTAASVLCGFATNLPMLIVSRILQGLFGGGLLAKAQAILFETFPPEEQAAAQGLFGVCVMVGPILGPTLGGWLTDTFDWRWIFFVNLPFGIIAVIMAAIFLPKDTQERGGIVDWLGILLLIVAVGSIQTVLEEGQQDDWLSSRFIVTLLISTVIGFIFLIWHELHTPHPAIDLKILKYKSLAAGSLYSLVLGMGLYGAMFAVPIFAQTILNYTSWQTGILLLPGAVASGLCMPIFAKLSGRVDARLLITFGSLLTAYSMFCLAAMNPDTNADTLFWPLVLRGIGTVMMFMPLSMATFGPLPKEAIGSASGFFSLTRQMGGSIGIAALTTLVSQRETFHRAVLSERINSYNPIVNEYLQRFASLGGHAMHHAGIQMQMQMNSMAAINGILEAQSAILSFEDTFWLAGIMFVISLPLVLFLGSGKSDQENPVAAH